jgi:hypothetical protein
MTKDYNKLTREAAKGAQHHRGRIHIASAILRILNRPYLTQLVTQHDNSTQLSHLEAFSKVQGVTDLVIDPTSPTRQAISSKLVYLKVSISH